MRDLQIESVDHLQRGSVNIYAANCGEDRRIIAESLYAFEKYDAETMVAELHDRPEFCQLAAAVHGLHLAESDATPQAEAIAILTKLRDSRQPEAIRTRAENLLIAIAEDDRAVCDASSVDDRPGQDAGEALVGVECYVIRDDTRVWEGPVEILEFDGEPSRAYGVGMNPKAKKAWYDHARPVYLGLPEATP